MQTWAGQSIEKNSTNESELKGLSTICGISEFKLINWEKANLFTVYHFL